MNDEHQLVIHPLTKGIRYTHHNNDFSVAVRVVDGDWQDLYPYKVIVDMDRPQPASMVQFDCYGKVEVRAKYKYGTVHSVVIRPLSQNIQPVIKGNYISFFLDKPVKLSVEINGDRHRNLHVFANPLETERPCPGDPNVMYFNEGIHVPEDTEKGINIPSNTTVYLAPGAVVQGKFFCEHAENIRFIGRGILDNPPRGFELKFCRNIEINGITVINPQHYTVCGGQCDGIKIRNLKSFSCKSWSDGIDMMSCSNVDIEDIFMRNSDDCIAIYTHRWDFFGDAKNYHIKNAILWADVAHPIHIGIHGDTSIEGNVIENLRFSEIDILDQDEDDREYQGCMALCASDHNLIQDVVFENIRIENITEGMLFNLRVLFNEKYSSGPGRGIHNITFRNILYNYTGWRENPSVINGFNDDRMVKDVHFDNIVINGTRVTCFKKANICIGEFTDNIILT